MVNFAGIKPDVIKYEVRRLSGTDINESQQKKRGGFGRFLSGLGRILGAVAAPLSFVFPPAALVAAGAYAGSKVGDMLQQKAAVKMIKDRDRQSGQELGQVFMPGMTQASMDLTRDTGRIFDPTQQRHANNVVEVLVARNDVDTAMAHSVEVNV